MNRTGQKMLTVRLSVSYQGYDAFLYVINCERGEIDDMAQGVRAKLRKISRGDTCWFDVINYVSVT